MWATEVNGVKVHLKMDALQPAGSLPHFFLPV
jgi:hypothetical protein